MKKPRQRENVGLKLGSVDAGHDLNQGHVPCLILGVEVESRRGGNNYSFASTLCNLCYCITFFSYSLIFLVPYILQSLQFFLLSATVHLARAYIITE